MAAYFPSTQAYGSTNSDPSSSSSSSSNREEEDVFEELISHDTRDGNNEFVDDDDDPHSISGKVVSVGPLRSFDVNQGRVGYVQTYILTDFLAKHTKKKIYQYRVTAWNDVAKKQLIKKGSYIKVSKFTWKENNFRNIPLFRSRYDVHLNSGSLIEHIPRIPSIPSIRM